MKKIYIAGKVTGEEPTACAAKFEAVERYLVAKGWQVFNPIKIVDNPNEVWQVAMDKCIDALNQANAIFMLPCAIDSKGAQIELDFAIHTNKDIYNDLKDL
jgi:hypothetical protein